MGTYMAVASDSARSQFAQCSQLHFKAMMKPTDKQKSSSTFWRRKACLSTETCYPNRCHLWTRLSPCRPTLATMSDTASRRAVVERGHATMHPPRTPSDRRRNLYPL